MDRSNFNVGAYPRVEPQERRQAYQEVIGEGLWGEVEVDQGGPVVEVTKLLSQRGQIS